MQAVNHTVEIERLYEELRECLQANDQAGVQRIFAELVRAKRPLAEIVGEVKRLTREIINPDPEPDPSATDQWAPPGAAPQTPEPTPEPTHTGFPSAAPPAAAPPSPQSAAAYHQPEPEPAAFRKWSSGDGLRASSSGGPELTVHRFDGSAAFDLRSRPEITVPAAAPTIEAPQKPRSNEWAEPAAKPEPEPESRIPEPPPPAAAPEPRAAAPEPRAAEPEPRAAAPEPCAAEPAPRIADPAPRPPEPVPIAPVPQQPTSGPPQPASQLTAVFQRVAGTTAGSGEDVPAFDPAPQSSAVTETGDAVPDAAPPISSRAMALGVRSDSTGDTEDAPSSGNSRVLVLVGAAAGITAIIGIGAFLFLKPAGDAVADKDVPAAVATATEPAAKPSPGDTTPPPAAPSGNPDKRAPGLAATPLLPGAPTPPAPAPSPSPTPPTAAAPSPRTAPAAPVAPAATKPEQKPAIASLEPPGGSPPKNSTTPDKPGSVTAPPAAVTPLPTVPAPAPQIETPPQTSSLETASLLENGDRMFGMGDVASARLFYERAAEAGDGQAALRLGETYDPNFLERAKLRAIKGDPKTAASWYWRAKELGVAEADILLKGVTK